jgi:hypothetical protein
MQSNLRAQAEIQAQRKKVCLFSDKCVCLPAMRRALLRISDHLFCQKKHETSGHEITCAKTDI